MDRISNLFQVLSALSTGKDDNGFIGIVADTLRSN